MGVIGKIKSRIPSNQNVIGQFLRYFVTGGLAFVVDFGVFAVAFYCFDIHYLLANLIGLMGGNVVNYLLSIGWVFSAEKRKMEMHRLAEITVFVLISLVGMGLNEFLMYVFVGILALQEMFSKVVAAIVVLLYNFFARKFILFKKKA
ncbi:GtrA family protein [Candidatus Saccharibacteria bacterium]|nr:GtrA family protein [Candidatus Saccharibacteria bacterium]